MTRLFSAVVVLIFSINAHGGLFGDGDRRRCDGLNEVYSYQTARLTELNRVSAAFATAREADQRNVLSLTTMLLTYQALHNRLKRVADLVLNQQGMVDQLQVVIQTMMFIVAQHRQNIVEWKQALIVIDQNLQRTGIPLAPLQKDGSLSVLDLVSIKYKQYAGPSKEDSVKVVEQQKILHSIYSLMTNSDLALSQNFTVEIMRAAQADNVSSDLSKVLADSSTYLIQQEQVLTAQLTIAATMATVSQQNFAGIQPEIMNTRNIVEAVNLKLCIRR